MPHIAAPMCLVARGCRAVKLSEGGSGWGQLNGETLLYTKSGQVNFHLITAGLVCVGLGQVRA